MASPDTGGGAGGLSDRPVALVTGASSGIGQEIARGLAERGYDLVLVARTLQALQLLADDVADHGAAARIIAADLTETTAPAHIAAALKADNIVVDVLVNNAGFGARGRFTALDLDRQRAMIRLNVEALTALTGLFLPGMLDRRRGRILNVASTAAFQPGPLQAVYFATKAYVLSFSEALSQECRGKGVTVTALCPGPTESGFARVAALEDSRLFRMGTMTSHAVADAGIRAMMAGKRRVVPGSRNRLTAWMVPLIPRQLVLPVVAWLQK